MPIWRIQYFSLLNLTNLYLFMFVVLFRVLSGDTWTRCMKKGYWFYIILRSVCITWWKLAEEGCQAKSVSYICKCDSVTMQLHICIHYTAVQKRVSKNQTSVKMERTMTTFPIQYSFDFLVLLLRRRGPSMRGKSTQCHDGCCKAGRWAK